MYMSIEINIYIIYIYARRKSTLSKGHSDVECFFIDFSAEA